MAGTDTVAVVGAGLAGLMCARRLAAAGRPVRVFDKGRGPGGRSCTRRTPAGKVDFGAQYFTCRSEPLAPFLQSWRDAGIAALWAGRIAVLERGEVRPERQPTARYVGVPGMSALAKDLATGLDLTLGARVIALERDGGWRLATEDGARHGPFGALALALPAPSVAALLEGLSPLAATARAVRMEPCWALLVGFEEALAVDFAAAFVHGAELRWVARDGSKPGRPAGEVWVLHADTAFSRREILSPPERVSRLLLEDFAAALGRSLPPPTFRIAHRWGYATVPEPLESGCLAQPGLVAGGDWCQGARVEGALRSGLAMADALLAS